MMITVTYAMWKSITQNIAGGPLTAYMVTSGATTSVCSGIGNNAATAVVFVTEPLDEADLADFNSSFPGAALLAVPSNLLASKVSGVPPTTT